MIWKKITYWAWGLLALPTVFLILYFLLVGGSCILTTVAFYGLLLASCYCCISLLPIRNKTLESNIKLVLTVIISCMLISEFLLRFVGKIELNYSERNGDFWYFDFQRAQRADYLFRKYILKENGMWVRVHKNTTHEENHTEFKYTHHYNSMGFRDQEPIIDSGESVILSLGDSFTEGVGAPQDSSYPVLLQKMLLLERGRKYHVLNAGQAGNDVCGEYMIYDQCFTRFHPKILLLLINNTDIRDIMERGGMERFHPDGRIQYPERPWWEPLTEISIIFRMYVHRVLKYDWSLIKDDHRIKMESEAQKKIIDCISNYIKPLCIKSDCKLVIILQPIQASLSGIDDLAFIRSRFASDRQTYCIDLLPIMKRDEMEGNINSKNIYWSSDGHFNSRGYAYIAKVINDQLLPLLDTMDVADSGIHER